MGHKKNKSMDFCKSGKSPLTNPTGKTSEAPKSSSKAEDLNKAATTGYNNLKKHEEKYKNNKSYKDALAKATIKKDQTSAYVEQDKNVDKVLNDKKQSKGSLYDKKTKTYDQAYDGLSAEKKAEYRKKGGGKEGSGRSSFKTDAKNYNKKRYGNTEPTKEAKATVKSKAYSDATNVKEAKAKMVKTQKVKASNKVKTDANDAKVAKETKAKSDQIKSGGTNPKTKKRSKVGKLATKVGNIFRKNKKDPNRKTKK